MGSEVENRFWHLNSSLIQRGSLLFLLLLNVIHWFAITVLLNYFLLFLCYPSSHFSKSSCCSIFSLLFVGVFSLIFTCFSLIIPHFPMLLICSLSFDAPCATILVDFRFDPVVLVGWFIFLCIGCWSKPCNWNRDW